MVVWYHPGSLFCRDKGLASVFYHQLSPRKDFQSSAGYDSVTTISSENEVHQDSMLSVTLFIVKMNSMASAVPLSISYLLYVDDDQISYASTGFDSLREASTTGNKQTG